MDTITHGRKTDTAVDLALQAASRVPERASSPTIDRILREAEVRRLTGLSRVTRWRLERDGRFPRRVQLSTNAVGWFENEIREFLLSRARAGSAIPMTSEAA